MREVRWERMFKDELDAAFADCPLAYFAYGLCEPHGPQNTVGLDALKAHGICCRAAHAHGGIVAPPDYWHIHEIGGYAVWSHGSVGKPERHWLTAMPPWQHFKNICYHIRTADALGFHAAIFVTGHYGPNYQDFKTLVELVQPYVGTRLYCLPDFEANYPGFDNDDKSVGDHAGKVETSLLWALEPDCVDVSRMPERDEPGEHFAMGKTAHDSNRQVGDRMVEDEVRWLGNKAKELLAAYDEAKPEHTLLTFEQVERMWAEAVLPKLKDFKTMQQHWGSQEPLPDGSQWATNYSIPTISGITEPG